MIPDILINDTSMLKLGWIRETVDFPSPGMLLVINITFGVF